MIARLRSLLRPAAAAPLPAVPDGERVYAVGDVHGRLDLLAALAAAIEVDDRARKPAQTTVVLLGDLVDRGPDSAGVIRFARDWQGRRQVRIIAGNHEEMFLAALGDPEIMRPFLRFGGRETLLSYGIDPLIYTRATLPGVVELARERVPADDRAFIARFEDTVAIGDYLFVHAGVRPDVALGEQTIADLRWIREPFLTHREAFGPVVVHGHTITDRPEFRSNRIGIDTGAYCNGRLTALRLEGTEQELLTAVETDDAIRVVQGD